MRVQASKVAALVGKHKYASQKDAWIYLLHDQFQASMAVAASQYGGLRRASVRIEEEIASLSARDKQTLKETCIMSSRDPNSTTLQQPALPFLTNRGL